LAQSNSEIASVYVKRAEESLFNVEFDESLEIFNKALKYLDSIPNSRVSKLGAMLYFEHGEFFNARSYARSYFELETDKTKEEYQNMLDIFVNIQEEIDKYIEEQKALEIQRQREEREARRIDSLSSLWTDLSKAYTIAIDSIHSFNKFNLAVFESKVKLGIINDRGTIIEQSSDYTDYLSYDGYILMLNKPNNPTKVYAFNCRTQSGFLLPSITAFNSSSTHYGKVMLPRANGLVVT
jgi:tetratricopeptide (TPR) repeat protein